MSTRIRGQEVSAYLVVDNKMLLGSFAKMESFKMSPIADITQNDFLGETESEFDEQHHGYDLSWTIHELDNQSWQVYANIVATLDAGLPQPPMNLIVIKTYRDPAIPPVTQVFQNIRMKLDSQEFGGRKDYVKNSFSAKCKTMRIL